MFLPFLTWYSVLYVRTYVALRSHYCYCSSIKTTLCDIHIITVIWSVSCDTHTIWRFLSSLHLHCILSAMLSCNKTKLQINLYHQPIALILSTFLTRPHAPVCCVVEEGDRRRSCRRSCWRWPNHRNMPVRRWYLISIQQGVLSLSIWF